VADAMTTTGQAIIGCTSIYIPKTDHGNFIAKILLEVSLQEEEKSQASTHHSHMLKK